MSRFAVIGGGFAGLAAAADLAARGHGVTLLEAGQAVGGKAQALDVGGARVDLGPTMLLDAAPLSELCARLGTSLDSVVTLDRLDPGFVARFGDGRTVAWHAGADALAGQIGRLGPAAAQDWTRFLDLGARAARLTDRYLRRGDIAGAGDVWRFVAGGGAGLRDVWPFARHASLAHLLAANVRTASLRTLLGHFARFVGLDAASAPAATLVIPYLLATRGVLSPRGGIAALAQTLARHATKHGARIETGTAVTGFEIAGRRVRSVRTADDRVEVDGCVAAVDIATAADWLPDRALRLRVGRLAPAMTASVAWWLIAGAPTRAHHTFVFDGVGEPVYVAQPTVTDPALAPPHVTVLYALVHHAAAVVRPGLADELRARLVATGQWPDGRVITRGLAAGAGSCYGYALRPGLLGAFHPSQRVPGVENLALAGGSVFPGPGVANAIRSGLRAAALVAGERPR